MVLQNPIHKGTRALRNPGLTKGYLSEKVFELVDKNVQFGMNIYDRDWDVLLVLDACRYDLFTEFAPEHPVFEAFDGVEPVYSCASATPVWLSRTFDRAPPEEVADTHYVSCTGFSTRVEDAGLDEITEVWRYAVDHEYGITRPEALTDAAIDTIRDGNSGRYIVHYVQPHAPFLHCPGKYNSTGGDETGTQYVWKGLKRGEFDRDEVWADYGRNVLTVLDEVQTIIDNVSGTVVITSDHGNALGEFGIYGHPRYCALPSLRKVPWVEASGKGLEEYEVQGRSAMRTGLGEHDLDENLRSLGYKE